MKTGNLKQLYISEMLDDLRKGIFTEDKELKVIITLQYLSILFIYTLFRLYLVLHIVHSSNGRYSKYSSIKVFIKFSKKLKKQVYLLTDDQKR